MTLGEGEPAAGPWRVAPLSELAGLLYEASGSPSRRPRVVAVDGRSSSGKTTLAGRLCENLDGAFAVHTDDVAWHHSFFGWADLLADGVLEPIHRGQAVAFRPPAWDARDRAGAIEVPAGAAVVIVEGVGAARRQLAHLLDATVWVQSDLVEIERRNLARMRAGELSEPELNAWMAEEFSFVAAQRPWERAAVIATGTPDLPYDPLTQVVIAPGPSRRGIPPG